MAVGTGMPITARERLARVLDGSPAPGAFSAQLSVPARDVRVTYTCNLLLDPDPAGEVQVEPSARLILVP